jgi:hypothetical protein
VDAGKDLGLSVSQLKRLCRQYDIRYWPRKKLLSLDSNLESLEKLRLSSESIHNSPIAANILTKIAKCKSDIENIIRDPNLGFKTPISNPM